VKFVKKLVKMRKICQVLLVLAGLSLGITSIGRTQQNAIEKLIPDPYDEWVAGSAGNLFLRGPWVAKSWRKPAVRLVVWSGLSAFYEKFLDRTHSGQIDGTAKLDWWQREEGYLLTEAIIFIGKKVF